MGLLDKLFEGNKDLEKAAKGLLNGILGAAGQNKDDGGSESGNAQAAAKPQERIVDDDAPSGFSWGENMPAEENQYNFNGTYWQYFENIFNTDFAEYRYEKNEIRGSSRIAYTFYSGASKVLVVELMPDTSTAYKLRKECEKEGVPYRRFYFDHPGWWNTRAYVLTRMRAAMK